MTLEQLKAQAYDLIKLIEDAKIKLHQTNVAIAQLAKSMLENTEKKEKAE